MNCAIYCRYSSDQQDSCTIEFQKKECYAYAEKQGWEVTKIYVDEAKSGFKNIEKREDFQEMMSDALSIPKPFDYVLVYQLSRFSRDKYDSVTTKFALRKVGIKVVSASEPITGSGNPEEILIETLFEGLNEYYSSSLSKSVLKRMAFHAKDYFVAGHPPFGYKLINIEVPIKGIRRKLAIEESESEIVRRIYDLYISGIGMTEIRNILNREGTKQRHGRRFDRNLIYRILHSEKYCGDSGFGFRQYKNRKFNFEPVMIKDTHEAIITRETWKKVQDILESKQPEKIHPRAAESDYLFSSFIRCGLCESQLVGKSAHGRSERYRYYVCSKNNRIGNECTGRNINADKFESRVFEKIKHHILDKENMIRMIKSYNELLKSVQEKQAKVIGRLKLEHINIDKKINNLIEAIEEKRGLTLEDVGDRIKQLKASKIEKQQEIDTMTQKLSEKSIPSTEEKLKAWADFWISFFNHLDQLPKKQISRGMIREIIVLEDYAEVHFNPELTKVIERVPMEIGSHDAIMATPAGFEPASSP